jgi:hypothetical protein
MQYAPGSKAMLEIESLFEEVSPKMIGSEDDSGVTAEAVVHDSEQAQPTHWQSLYSL